MSLTLHYHPLSSYCHKALIALYEMETPFEPRHLNLGDAEEKARFRALWPIGKMPVIEDSARGVSMAEATLVIEYVDTHYPGPFPLLPSDPDERLEMRRWDRVFDLYMQTPMQKHTGDVHRPEGAHDPHGVCEAEGMLRTAYGMLDIRMKDRDWVMGDSFTLADCAAVPALFYGGLCEPFADSFPHVNAYFERLLARASVARVLEEAKPWLQYFPRPERIPARFR